MQRQNTAVEFHKRNPLIKAPIPNPINNLVFFWGGGNSTCASFKVGKARGRLGCPLESKNNLINAKKIANLGP